MNKFPFLKLIVTIFILSSFLFPQQRKLKVACIGNSITQGFGNTDPRSYPSQLGVMLGAHYEVKNFGLGGRTMLKKGDYPYWKEQMYQDALNYNADIVIISLGTNDTKTHNWIYRDEFFGNYLEFVNSFRKNGKKPQIFVCFPPPLFWKNPDGTISRNADLQFGVIPLIDSVRSVAKTDLIDYNKAMYDKNEMFPDNVHPDEKGYKLMAEIAYQEIINSPSGIIRYFFSKKNSFEKGESVRLYWETTKNSNASIDGKTVGDADSIDINPVGNTVVKLITNGVRKDTSSVSLEYLAPGKIKTFTVDYPQLEAGGTEKATLSWSASAGSQVKINNEIVSVNGTREVSPSVTTEYVLQTTGYINETKTIKIEVTDAEKINRAVNRFVKSSSVLQGFNQEYINDASAATCWRSAKTSSTQWIYVDLGKSVNINKIKVNWGNLYASSFRAEVINETNKVENVYTNTTAQGGISDISGFSVYGRYVRLVLIKSIEPDSGFAINEMEIFGTTKTTDTKEDIAVPEAFNLEQNYPNPFNPATKINYSIDEEGIYKLEIFSVTGEMAETVFNKEIKPGKYSLEFDASKYSSGVYFYRISGNGKSIAKKMLLIK